MPDEEKAYSVTEAMTKAKQGLEQIRLSVVGEVSEFNDKPGYKAAYFTIRDDDCAMPCLMWRDIYDASGVQLRPGLLVELTGRFSAYIAKGRMQFTVSKLRLAGEGNLRLQVAQLAEKLAREGLMDPKRKRPTPALPKRIALITSPRGKAVHDVIRTLRRRYPLGELLVFGVPVEGADAPAHLRSALEAAQGCTPAPDVILLVRGGGSYEDLMPFNDEQLARTIAASSIPVVTGIGHEPDNSLADMVADRRCSTPTAAAESVALSVEELQSKVDNATALLGNALVNRLKAAEHRLARLVDRPIWQDPHYLTGAYLQTLDMMSRRLARAIPEALAADAHRLELSAQRLRSMGTRLIEPHGRKVALSAARLEALSPLKTLSRGYSITYAADGHTVIDSVGNVKAGESLSVQVADGLINCDIISVEGKN